MHGGVTSFGMFGNAKLRALISYAAVVSASPAIAGCDFEPQGEGRVVSVIDARSFRMDDGREVRLAGIEVMTDGSAVLAPLIMGQAVTLHGETDGPDRYGRQP